MNNIIAVSAAAEMTTEQLNAADEIVIAFSGGKDSLACVLHLIELGYKHKLVLMHHDIDGIGAGGSELFDWPCTPSYCRAVANHLGLTMIESGRTGGFIGELNKSNAKSGGYWIDDETGHHHIPFKGKENTRRRFPAIAASLMTRWCSAFLKIDVGAVVIRQRYNNMEKVVFISGERREESSNRAKYNEVEQHRTYAQSKRHVTHWRPVIDWSEREVWAIIERHNIIPHPAYYLGWGRLSCMTCIFGSKNQWASVRYIAPKQFADLAAMEQDFDHTIHSKKSVTQLADEGEVYPECYELWATKSVALDSSDTYQGEITPASLSQWQLPAGAYGESNGPT